jgi:hypothetical protein
MSSNGVPLQEISDTVGHKSTHVTETVHRHLIVPAIRGGAAVMESVGPGAPGSPVHVRTDGQAHRAELAPLATR